jgi:hypothetical protein
MLPYTAGDGLQIIAREYGFIVNHAKESEPDSTSGLRAVWNQMLRPFHFLKAV